MTEDSRFDEHIASAFNQNLSYNKARKKFKQQQIKFISKQTYYALRKHSKGEFVSSKKFSTKRSKEIKKRIRKSKVKSLKKIKSKKVKIKRDEPRRFFRSVKFSYSVEIFTDYNTLSGDTVTSRWGKAINFGDLLTEDQAVSRYKNFRALSDFEIQNYDYVRKVTFIRADLYDIRGNPHRLE